METLKEIKIRGLLIGAGVFAAVSYFGIIVSYFTDEAMLLKCQFYFIAAIIFFACANINSYRRKWISLFTYDVLICVFTVAAGIYYDNLPGGYFPYSRTEPMICFVFGCCFVILLIVSAVTYFIRNR